MLRFLRLMAVIIVPFCLTACTELGIQNYPLSPVHPSSLRYESFSSSYNNVPNSYYYDDEDPFCYGYHPDTYNYSLQRERARFERYQRNRYEMERLRSRTDGY